MLTSYWILLSDPSRQEDFLPQTAHSTLLVSKNEKKLFLRDVFPKVGLVL